MPTRRLGASRFGPWTAAPCRSRPASRCWTLQPWPSTCWQPSPLTALRRRPRWAGSAWSPPVRCGWPATGCWPAAGLGVPLPLRMAGSRCRRRARYGSWPAPPGRFGEPCCAPPPVRPLPYPCRPAAASAYPVRPPPWIRPASGARRPVWASPAWTLAAAPASPPAAPYPLGRSPCGCGTPVVPTCCARWSRCWICKPCRPDVWTPLLP